MVKTPPNQAIEFNPRGTLIIPQLYDDFQKASQSSEDYLRRAYHFSEASGKNLKLKVKFLTLVQWVQMPNMKDKIKEEGLEDLAKYARIWVENYAPQSEKFELIKVMPVNVKNLSDKQKEYLRKVAGELDKDWDAENFQEQLYEWAKEIGVSSKDAFTAIYSSLIGKSSGPKAGWLILENKEFAKKRFEKVSR